ncbi:branched-chain amino acid transporter permease [Streptomyces sp. 8L]|uniref:branched-chain amino acid transporter permease n=1 Tax=Streptomyces sp. 8L TaxID=2877242 RepID=UPI001CD2F110|nr:AzlD domain-containing protein [Streptomyces sp. 8L]MCA1218359.1 AzlD domain-containing protein [Streptomyces sp. 8L]
MPEPRHVAAIVAIAAVLTLGLRALPFAVVGRLREARGVRAVARLLPPGLMVILLVYLVLPPGQGTRHAPGALPWPAPQLAAVAVTVALQAWRRSTLLSIASGTAVSLLLS